MSVVCLMHQIAAILVAAAIVVPWADLGFAAPSTVAAEQSVALEESVPGSRDALPLALRIRGTSLEAAACSGWGTPDPERCDGLNAAQAELPATCAASEFRLHRLALAGGGAALRIKRRVAEGGATMDCDWQAVIVAQPRRAGAEGAQSAYAGPSDKPWIVYSGPLSPAEGAAVRFDSVGKGKNQVLVGEHNPAVQLCNRPALLNPRLLDVAQMRLRRVGYQQVALSEQRTAKVLAASLSSTGTLPIDLTSEIASSAKEAPAFAVDGNAATRWSEGRRGTGAGEYLVLKAQGAAPVRGVSFVRGKGPSPSKLWLQSDTHTYQLEFPPLTRESSDTQEVHFQLPETDTTRCLALSLIDAAVPLDSEQSDVGLAEVKAWSALQDRDLERYIVDLSAPEGERAAVAADVLAVHGLASVRRASAAYPTLSESGRARALSLFSRFGCRATEGFAAALASVELTELDRAERGLSGCGVAAARGVSEFLRPRLEQEPTRDSARTPRGAAVVSSRQHEARLLEHLALSAPSALVDLVLPYLGKGKRARRHPLRNALLQALETEAGRESALGRVQDPALDTRAAVTLVYALSAWVADQPRVQSRVLSLLSQRLTLRSRYLLLTPVASWLSAPGRIDPRLQAFYRSALSKDAPLVLRVRAMRIAPRPRFTPNVVAGLSHPEVRVREAAVLNLAEPVGADLTALEVKPLQARLEKDPWPLVRAEAARTLGAVSLPQALSQPAAEALAEAAEEDESPHVRRPALYALGARQAQRQLPVIREVFRNDGDPHVRGGAAAVLGILCDKSEVEALYESALKLRHLTSSGTDRIVGRAALSALGRLAPRDLRQRLQPLFGKKVPAAASRAAEQAIHHPKICTSR